ncbi:hypothetical protein R6Q59_023557 [Mikania micrantha]
MDNLEVAKNNLEDKVKESQAEANKIKKMDQIVILESENKRLADAPEGLKDTTPRLETKLVSMDFDDSESDEDEDEENVDDEGSYDVDGGDKDDKAGDAATGASGTAV